MFLSFQDVGVKFKKKNQSRKINYSSDEYWAFDSVSFELFRGQSLGVLGKNGAGKSTLLSVVSGIINVDRGHVVNQFSHTFLLSLQAGFLNHLSGRKNILLVTMLLGLPKALAIEKMDEIIGYSELEEFIDSPVGSYSSGMKARLGFAIASFIEPDLILIDEVLGVGDTKFKEKSFKTIKEKIEKMTAIIVSHNENTLSDLCDKGLVIDKGKSLFYGEIDEAIRFYNSI